MKKIIVVSDTHGSKKGLDSIRALIAENDCLVHLGDGAYDVRELQSETPDKFYVVRGNCDFFSPLPEEWELEIERVKIYVCHGHKYGVKSSLISLAREAKRRGCQVAFYGHTHDALISEIDGVTLINPGSFKRPVGEGGSYAYVVIEKEKVTPVLVGQSVF
jgi:putative phosphoesterase